MKRKPFVLILSTSGGAGHHRAAEALLQAARTSNLPLTAQHHDCLEFTSRAFRHFYSQSYLSMVNHLPELWGYVYGQSERTPYSKQGLLALFDHFNYRRYLQALEQFKPDAILCTHFLPYISISERVRQSNIAAPFFAATTDFDIHQFWVDPIVSHYYVFHDESAWQLSAKGIPRERISVTGIPVAAEFGTKAEHRTVRQQLEIPTNRFTVLLLSGGFGVGRVKVLAQSITEVLASKIGQPFNLLVVCGRNESLQNELRSASYPPNVHVSVFGYVSFIHDLMDAADILISKSGGLTCAETLAKQLPIIIVDPIPGQESHNATMIIERGAGLLALDYHNLQYKLNGIIEDPSRLQDLREASRSLAKPRAAEEIIRDVYARIAH
ncbi:MAG TPA: glycosyltransferase [Bacteroidota bacterium]|nr:glycosyltransferase [Bacteroidota bacterium]